MEESAVLKHEKLNTGTDSSVPDPNPDPLSASKNSKKNLDSYCFVIFLDFLSLKNYFNVPSKSNKQKNFFLISFLLAS
jgi:hypothetical protein